MNNMPFPYMPYPYPFTYPNNNNQNIEQELNNIRNDIKKLEQRIALLEKKDIKDYSKKEPGMYMMWTQMCSFFCRKILYVIY